MNSASSLISLTCLLLTACQPTNNGFEQTLILAPVSESLKIGEVSFMHYNQTKPNNVYGSSLEGHVRFLIEDYRQRSLEGFDLHIRWTLLSFKNEVILSNQFEHVSNIPSYQLWLDIPLDGYAPQGTYHLTVQFFETRRKESFGYQQEFQVSENPAQQGNYSEVSTQRSARAGDQALQ